MSNIVKLRELISLRNKINIANLNRLKKEVSLLDKDMKGITASLENKYDEYLSSVSFEAYGSNTNFSSFNSFITHRTFEKALFDSYVEEASNEQERLSTDISKKTMEIKKLEEIMLVLERKILKYEKFIDFHRKQDFIQTSLIETIEEYDTCLAYNSFGGER